MNQVINAAARFRAQYPQTTPASGQLEALEARLRGLSRMQLADRVRMATNLGNLAARVTPDRPQDGARRMFRRLGGAWEAKWKKRRRLLLLPGEARHEDEVPESGSATFLALARMAGELLADGQEEPLVERSRLAALRSLLLGTSFGPALPPVSATLASGGELLTDALNRIAGTIGQETQLLELWSLLDTTPFGVDRVEDDTEGPSDDPFVDAKRLADGLPKDFWKQPWTLRFDPADADVSWSEPTIKIGCLAVERELPLFRIPPEVAPLFVWDEEEAGLSSAAEDWLSKVGESGGHLPDIAFDPDRGVGWKDQSLLQLYTVYLSLERDRGAKPELTLGFYDLGSGPTFVLGPVSRIDPGTIGRAMAEPDSVHDSGPSISWRSEYIGLRLPAWWPAGDSRGSPGQILGYFENPLECPDAGINGRVEDEGIAPFALSAESMRFFPTFELDEHLPGLLPPDSLGAALLRNIAAEDSERRLDRMLRERAEGIARAGLCFHEKVVEYYRDRLSTL